MINYGINFCKTLIYVLTFFLLLTGNSYAYLDPFTGGILIKILVFIFSIVVVFFKKLIRLKNWIKNKIFFYEKKSKNK